MLPILASTERELAICEEDVKMNTWLALVMFDPLRFDRTTPGIARNPTLAVNITVDWITTTWVWRANHIQRLIHTHRITPSHSPNSLVMELSQAVSIITSSVHNFFISRRWTSGAKKSSGDRHVMSSDLSHFGLL
jgi:hypothetical protein